MTNTKKEKNNRNLALGIGIGSLVFLIAGSLVYHFSKSTATCNSDKTVDIATNLPLTGNLATYGTAVQNGAMLAIDNLKKSDPSSCLNFDWEDNAGAPNNAVGILQKQFLQTPEIYVSGVRPQTMAIKDQVTAKGIPHFVWIFDAFINKNSNNNFRTWVSYKIEPPIFLNYAKERAAKRVAIVYVQLPHSVEEFEKIVIPGLKKQGVQDILVEPFDFGKKDFKDIAVKIKNFNPDLIILNGFQGDLVGLVRALRPFGLINDGNTIATYDMLDAANILGASELEGIRVVAPIFVTRPDQGKVKLWKEQFRAKYNKEPLYTDAFAYDMAMIIHDTANRLKLPATSAQWIEALKTTDIEGITGPLNFDSGGDLKTPLEVGVFREGKLVPLLDKK
jgi:branched-chain amino acid transport system substrate-binding protein